MGPLLISGAWIQVARSCRVSQCSLEKEFDNETVYAIGHQGL